MMKRSLWTKDFVLLAMANLLMAISFYFMLPILPIYLVDKLGATKAEVGLILSFYTIAALIIRLFAGWAIDTYGRKSIYLPAFAIYAFTFSFYPIVSSVFFFLIVRFLHGLTWGTLTTSSSTIAVDLIPPQRRGEGIGIFGLSMTIGMAIGPFIAILITGESRFALLFTTAIGVSFVGLLMAFQVTFPKFTAPTPKRTLTVQSMIEKSSLLISLNMILIMFTYGGIISFISLYGKEIGIANTGPFFLILSLGIGLSRVGSGKFIDSRGPSRISITGLCMLVLGFPILALVPNQYGFYFSAITLGLGFGIVMPTFQTMVNNLVTPNRRGAANSTFFTAFDVGIGLGMIGTGLLSQQLGFQKTFIIFAIVNAVAIVQFASSSYPYYKKNLKSNS